MRTSCRRICDKGMKEGGAPLAMGLSHHPPEPTLPAMPVSFPSNIGGPNMDTLEWGWSLLLAVPVAAPLSPPFY